MDRTSLLVVDDEVDLLAELKSLLERSGYAVQTAMDGEAALAMIQKQSPDLIILDVLMPRMDGRELLRRLRQMEDWTPIILLTQVGTPSERAMSLHEGADDYLNKPFDPMELVARIEAVLRRTKRNDLPLTAFRRLVSGSLQIDRQTRQATLAERELALTARAFAVLERLMLQAGDIMSRERLLDEVWGWSHVVETRAVDIRIAELRKALGDDPGNPRFIETVIGAGYRFLPGVEGHA